MNDTVVPTSVGGMKPPTFREALAVWARIGLISFGGPAGQIALMHRVLVDERKWIDEPRYLNALNFCMLLPGPEAMQLATYVGWRLHGIKGGLAAGLLFVVPGALVVLALSMIYAAYGKVPAVEALFFGVKAAVLAIVVEALLRIARRSLKDRAAWWLAGFAFVAIFFFSVPFPLIVLAAAIFGFMRGAGAPAAHRWSKASPSACAHGRDDRTVARHLGPAAHRAGHDARPSACALPACPLLLQARRRHLRRRLRGARLHGAGCRAGLSAGSRPARCSTGWDWRRRRRGR